MEARALIERFRNGRAVPRAERKTKGEVWWSLNSPTSQHRPIPTRIPPLHPSPDVVQHLSLSSSLLDGTIDRVGRALNALTESTDQFLRSTRTVSTQVFREAENLVSTNGPTVSRVGEPARATEEERQIEGAAVLAAEEKRQATAAARVALAREEEAKVVTAMEAEDRTQGTEAQLCEAGRAKDMQEAAIIAKLPKQNAVVAVARPRSPVLVAAASPQVPACEDSHHHGLLQDEARQRKNIALEEAVKILHTRFQEREKQAARRRELQRLNHAVPGGLELLRQKKHKKCLKQVLPAALSIAKARTTLREVAAQAHARHAALHPEVIHAVDRRISRRREYLHIVDRAAAKARVLLTKKRDLRERRVRSAGAFAIHLLTHVQDRTMRLSLQRQCRAQFSNTVIPNVAESGASKARAFVRQAEKQEQARQKVQLLKCALKAAADDRLSLANARSNIREHMKIVSVMASEAAREKARRAEAAAEAEKKRQAELEAEMVRRVRVKRLQHYSLQVADALSKGKRVGDWNDISFRCLPAVKSERGTTGLTNEYLKLRRKKVAFLKWLFLFRDREEGTVGESQETSRKSQ
jgi:hypothetical protein